MCVFIRQLRCCEPGNPDPRDRWISGLAWHAVVLSTETVSAAVRSALRSSNSEQWTRSSHVRTNPTLRFDLARILSDRTWRLYKTRKAICQNLPLRGNVVADDTPSLYLDRARALHFNLDTYR